MNFTDIAINYYLRFQQFCSTYYRLFWLHIFNIKELKAHYNNQTHNIIWRYFIFNILNKLVYYLECLKAKVNINMDKVHATKITAHGDKTIILESKNDESLTLDTISKELLKAEPDDTMLNCILINFDLVNCNNEKVCLKEYAVKYKDVDESYQHTLKNIFVFNDIVCPDDAKISIRIAKNRKITTHELSLKEVHDKHINYFINL